MAFRDLTGQPELRKALLTELGAGTVSQVTLLTGPEGSGKQSWGTALARVLLCPAGTVQPCGVCLSCRQLATGNHPNFFLLKPAGRWLKIDQIREIRPKFHLISPGGERRVLLICEADRMTPEAGSSLLKLLEEPPEKLFIILTSSHPEKLLSTIVSRCRRYVLKLLTAGEIVSLLKGIPELPEVNVDLIARLSRGLPGQALALARDPALGERVKLAVELAQALASPSAAGLDLFRRAPLLAEREDLVPLLELIYMYYRDALIWQLSGRSDLLIFPGYSEWPRFSSDTLEQCLEAINQAIRSIAFTNAHQQLALEAMIILLRRRFAGA